MISQPKCHQRKCKHFQGAKSTGVTESTQVVFCPAFPDGIPFEIAFGDDLHLEVHSIQNNDIIFEKEI